MNIFIVVIIAFIVIISIIISFGIYNNYKINKYFDSKDFKSLYQFYSMRDPDYYKLNARHFYYMHKCSRQVCQAAENKPIEYIIKYFFSDGAKASQYINRIKEEKERIQNLKSIYNQQCSRENEYWTKILNSAPPCINTKQGRKRLESYRKSTNVPNHTCFSFYYTSPKGNSSYNFEWRLTADRAEELLSALEKKYGRGGISSPTTGGTPDRKWIQEERNKINRIFSNGKTLRDFILARDNYTCKKCGNSVAREPNLLLEVDHIIPVSKWGRSEPDNLQTLCWKCNRSKSNK